MPEVVADPQGEVARTFQELGVCIVQQCAKIRQQGTLSRHKILWKHVSLRTEKEYLLYISHSCCNQFCVS